MPKRKNVMDAIIQLLSPVLGSAAVVAVAALGLDDVVTVVLFTVVLVVADVLGDVVAGFTAGSVDVSSLGFPAAGSVLQAGLPAPPPGVSRTSLSPAGPAVSWGLDHYMRGHSPAGIQHASSPKGPTGGRHKARGR